MNIKLIAIGSRIMGDDGAAIEAAEKLYEELAAEGIQVIIGETDVEYCLSCINEGDIIIILDASISGRLWGTTWQLSLWDALNGCNQNQFQHDGDLLNTLSMKGLQLSGLLICIEAMDISQGWGLSQALQSQIARICYEIKNMILEFRGDIKMHDSILLQRITTSLQRICEENNLGKIKETVIEVSYNSHIDSKDLHEHLMELIPDLVDVSTIITIKKTELAEQTAVIYMLKGEGIEAE